MPKHPYGSWRTTCGSLSSPSIMWGQGLNSGHHGLYSAPVPTELFQNVLAFWFPNNYVETDVSKWINEVKHFLWNLFYISDSSSLFLSLKFILFFYLLSYFQKVVIPNILVHALLLVFCLSPLLHKRAHTYTCFSLWTSAFS